MPGKCLMHVMWTSVMCNGTHTTGPPLAPLLMHSEHLGASVQQPEVEDPAA